MISSVTNLETLCEALGINEDPVPAPKRPLYPPREDRWQYSAVLCDELQAAGFDPLLAMREVVAEARAPWAWLDLVAFVRRLGQIRLPHHLVPDFEEFLPELLLEVAPAQPVSPTEEATPDLLGTVRMLAVILDDARKHLDRLHALAYRGGAPFKRQLWNALNSLDASVHALESIPEAP